MIRKRSGQTDGQTDGHVRHTIIRPVIDGRIKINTTGLYLSFPTLSDLDKTLIFGIKLMVSIYK
jgi:hypothetical protein